MGTVSSLGEADSLLEAGSGWGHLGPSPQLDLSQWEPPYLDMTLSGCRWSNLPWPPPLGPRSALAPPADTAPTHSQRGCALGSPPHNAHRASAVCRPRGQLARRSRRAGLPAQSLEHLYQPQQAGHTGGGSSSSRHTAQPLRRGGPGGAWGGSGSAESGCGVAPLHSAPPG